MSVYGSYNIHLKFSVLSGDSFKNGKKKLDYVFCEIEDPAVNQVPVKKYLHFWEKYKFRRIDMQYIQPALSGVQKPVHGLWLTVSASNGIADEIVLSSTVGDFYVPQAFVTEKLTYTRDFTFPTYPGQAAGWRSICLPFTVENIIGADGQSLAPFNAEENT